MIFPQPISSTLPTSSRFRLQRPSRVQAEEATAPVFAVAPVYLPYPVRQLPFMSRNFSAQLLEMGLRYGIDEMIPGREENRTAFYAEDALRQYERAEGNFDVAHTPAFY